MVETARETTRSGTILDNNTVNMVDYRHKKRRNVPMKIEKNVEIPKPKQTGVATHTSPEYEALKEFVNSNDENICFTYETLKEADNKINTLRSGFTRNGLGKFLKLHKRENQIFVTHKEDDK